MKELEDRIKSKYPEVRFDLVKDTELGIEEKIAYIVKDKQKWIPLEILGEYAGFKEPRIQAQNLFKRNIDELKQDSAKIKLITVENNIKKTREITCLNIVGSRIFLMLARTEQAKRYRRFIAKLLDSVSAEPVALSVGDVNDKEILKMQLEIELLRERNKNEEIKLEKAKMLQNLARNYPKPISEESQFALEALGTKVAVPEAKDIIDLLLPTIEKEYTATEIAREASKKLNENITARKIGEIADKLKIKRNPELCRVVPLVLNEIGNNTKIKEVSQFRYKETAKEMILNHLIKKGKQKFLDLSKTGF